MAEAIADRVRRYILDGSDEDLRRLLGVAETTREMARSAFRRVGMQEGWHAIDCGCGPIGGLAVMAEMAGPARGGVGGGLNEAALPRGPAGVGGPPLGQPGVVLCVIPQPWAGRAGASGVETGQQIDDLVSDLRAAKGGGYEWVSMPFFLDLTLRKPLAA